MQHHIAGQDFSDVEANTIKAMFKDPRFDPEEFKHVLRKHGFKRKNSMRNQPCPCGSGKKTKVCCWRRLPK